MMEKVKRSITLLATKLSQSLIPGVGIILALGLGRHRWQQKEYTLATAELASGVATLAPGLGSGVALLIDLAIIGCDLYEPAKLHYDLLATVAAD